MNKKPVSFKRVNKFGYSNLIKIQGVPTLFKNLGYKLTKPREQILSELYNADKPMTAEHIALKLQKIDRATVYRTLEYFSKVKMILKINLRGDSFFYEMNDTHHHHIVCKSCDYIEEIEYCELPNPMLYSKKFSFVNEHSLEFFGKCKNCV